MWLRRKRIGKENRRGHVYMDGSLSSRKRDGKLDLIITILPRGRVWLNLRMFQGLFSLEVSLIPKKDLTYSIIITAAAALQSLSHV